MDVANGSVDQVRLDLARSEQAFGESADAGERQVLSNRHRLDQAIALPVLGDQHKARSDSLGDTEPGGVLAVKQHPAAGGREPARNAFHHFRAARAHQTVNADDLASPDIEREAVDH